MKIHEGDDKGAGVKKVFERGFLTGLVGGLGFDLFFDYFTEWQMTALQLLWGLVGGALFGVLMGLLMMFVLLCLRWLDRRTGWQLARHLEQSEPGLLGLGVGLLLTFPGATAGGVGFGVGAFKLLQLLYHQSPTEWSFAITAFMAILVFPLVVIAGVAGGAMLGAAVGSGLVGLVRGLVRGLLRGRSTGL